MPSAEQLRALKADEIDLLSTMAARRNMPRQWKKSRPDFTAAISAASGDSHVAIIADYAQATPADGMPGVLPARPEAVAQRLEGAGVCAVSVWTEEHLYIGRIGFLERMLCANLPLLRRDIIFHQLQVMETASTPAAALTITVRAVADAARLRVLIQQAQAYGMQAVAEVFDRADLDLAREAGARVILVNALHPVTGIPTGAPALSPNGARRENEVWLAAGGAQSAAYSHALNSAGFDALVLPLSVIIG